jgi:DNA polymerase-1
MPDDIRSNVPYIRSIIEAMRIPVLEADGYEADDVIGTLGEEGRDTRVHHVHGHA